MIIAGVDEVGRGCWAGPLVAGAVILAEPIHGLKDSKKLSERQRQILAAEIEVSALDIGLGWVTPKEIDTSGITTAVKTAMERALQRLRNEYDELIIDGNINFFPANLKARAVIKADDSMPAVSAASIIAKVARDKYMTELAWKYPEYGFEKHVGYGTAAHLAALQRYGVTAEHRKSYKPIRALL